MMTTKLLKIEIDSIESSKSISDFDSQDLDSLSNEILTSEGLIRPIVLKQKKGSFEQFEIVDGDLEYHAVVIASEKNPNIAEVNAVVISESDAEYAVQQRQLLRELDKKESGDNLTLESSTEKGRVFKSAPIDRGVVLKYENLQQLLGQNEQLKQISKQIAEIKKVEPLDLFNNADKVQLFSILRNNYGEKEANKRVEAIEEERQKCKFSSLLDLVSRVKIKRGKKEIRAMSEAKMLELVDIWSKQRYVSKSVES